MIKLFINSIYTTGFKIVSAIIKLILVWFITNRFGAGLYGAYTLALTIFLFINSILRFGFDVYLQKETTRLFLAGMSNRADFLFTRLLVISGFFILISTIVIIGLIWLFEFQTNRSYFIAGVSIYGVFYGIMWFYSYFLRGLKLGNSSVFLIEIIFPSLNIIFLFFFPLCGFSKMNTLIHAFGISIILTVILFYFRHPIKFKLNDIVSSSKIKSELTKGLPFLFISTSSMLLSWIDYFVLSLFEENSELGIYAVASRISFFLLFPVSALSIHFAPNIIRYLKSESLLKLRHEIYFISKFLFVISICLFIFINIFNKQILSFFGNEFIEGQWVLFVLSFAFLLNAAAGIFETVILMSDYQNKLIKINLIVASTNLILNIPLIYFFGSLGASIGTLGAIIVNRKLQWRVIKKSVLIIN